MPLFTPKQALLLWPLSGWHCSALGCKNAFLPRLVTECITVGHAALFPHWKGLSFRRCERKTKQMAFSLNMQTKFCLLEGQTVSDLCLHCARAFFSNLMRCVLRRKLVLLLGSRGASHFYKVFGSDPNNPSVIWDCQILSPYSGHSLREKGNGNINLWISELQPCFGSWLLAYFVTSKAILWKTSSLFILVKCFHNPKGRKVAASVMGCKTALISEKRRNTVKQSTPLHLTWHLDLVLMCSFLLLFYSSYQLLTYPKMLLFSKQSLQLKIMKHHV